VRVLVLEITPFTISVPPLAWVNVCVEAAAAPRINGASIVLVPVVFAALIAPAAPVPILVNVSLMPVFELVISYPDDVAVEKFKIEIVSDALRFGLVPLTVPKVAVSPAPGT
jgi:hypothetical protein